MKVGSEFVKRTLNKVRKQLTYIPDVGAVEHVMIPQN